jgi:hypothetical protein
MNTAKPSEDMVLLLAANMDMIGARSADITPTRYMMPDETASGEIFLMGGLFS